MRQGTWTPAGSEVQITTQNMVWAGVEVGVEVVGEVCDVQHTWNNLKLIPCLCNRMHNSFYSAQYCQIFFSFIQITYNPILWAILTIHWSGYIKHVQWQSRLLSCFMHRGDNRLCFILGRPQDADGCKYRSLMGAQSARARALTPEPYSACYCTPQCAKIQIHIPPCVLRKLVRSDNVLILTQPKLKHWSWVYQNTPATPFKTIRRIRQEYQHALFPNIHMQN